MRVKYCGKIFALALLLFCFAGCGQKAVSASASATSITSASASEDFSAQSEIQSSESASLPDASSGSTPADELTEYKYNGLKFSCPSDYQFENNDDGSVKVDIGEGVGNLRISYMEGDISSILGEKETLVTINGAAVSGLSLIDEKSEHFEIEGMPAYRNFGACVLENSPVLYVTCVTVQTEKGYVTFLHLQNVESDIDSIEDFYRTIFSIKPV